MALHALDLARVKAMTTEQRLAYFIKYAGNIEDSPKLCYAIRVGSTTLMSDDTFDLRCKFEEFLGPRVPYKKPAAEFLREHGWSRAYWIPLALRTKRNQHIVWWTKTEDNNAIPQKLALKQQEAENRKHRKQIPKKKAA